MSKIDRIPIMARKRFKQRREIPGSPSDPKDPELMDAKELLTTYNAIMTVGTDSKYMHDVWNEILKRLYWWDAHQEETHSGLILPS